MSGGRLHAVTWLVWAIAAAACVQIAPNPLYVGLVIGVAWLVVSAHGNDGPLAKAFPLLVGAGAIFGLVKVALTVATTHGIGHVLVHLPAVTLPRLLGGFTLGGTVEDMVLARAAAEAFAIVGIMAAFGAFNAVVAHDELVRSLPRSFHETGVVLAVGLAFVPATVTSARLVREADLARTGGQPVRRGRVKRTAVPVLERGMERAVLLSESMDSRGFGRARATGGEQLAGWLSLIGLLALVGSGLALVGGASAFAAGLFCGGGVAVATAVLIGSRASTRTRYRARWLASADLLVIGSAVVAIGGVVLQSSLAGHGFAWPGDRLAWPTLDPVTVVFLLLLGTPALFVPSASRVGPVPERAE